MHNYTVLSNKIDKTLLDNVKDYEIINEESYENIKDKIEKSLNKKIVFNETFYSLTISEVNKILELMKTRKMFFINFTSNVEETLLGDYLYVVDNGNVVMEGKTKDILKEEKILKHLGFGLPFVVDLSIQLKCYDILDKEYFDMESLVDDLWN